MVDLAGLEIAQWRASLASVPAKRRR